ncbi:MAG: hypothetical protein M3O36_11430, partial [Myxococcota bacterium]|nr:hypothetical protein [Myxococcota bacterium]
WNLGEASAAGSVLGYITAGVPTPAYYAEKMVSANLHGDILAPAGVPSGFSVYASHDPSAAMTAVLVLNKTTSGGALSFAVGGGAAKSFEFPAISVSLVQMPDAPGSAPRLLRYTADLAAANLPPQLVP